jgi:CYTH domain-containing protein
MAEEIEKKFLLADNGWQGLAEGKAYCQGYLNSEKGRTVRVRIIGEQGFLTIKGKGNSTGTTRMEWETEIPLQDAEKLLTICENGIIDKTRHEVIVGNHMYEVDVFAADNVGLIVAEIELQSEDEAFEKPSWLGKEVTNDERFYNAYLSIKPFKTW